LELETEASSHDLKSMKTQMQSLDDEIKLACAREQHLHQELMQANKKVSHLF
jgi:hypothetical protein